MLFRYFFSVFWHYATVFTGLVLVEFFLFMLESIYVTVKCIVSCVQHTKSCCPIGGNSSVTVKDSWEAPEYGRVPRGDLFQRHMVVSAVGLLSRQLLHCADLWPQNSYPWSKTHIWCIQTTLPSDFPPPPPFSSALTKFGNVSLSSVAFSQQIVVTCRGLMMVGSIPTIMNSDLFTQFT